VRIFSLVVYGVIAASGIFRGVKQSLLIFHLRGILSTWQWSKLLLLLTFYVIPRVLCPLGLGLIFAVLFLRQWKGECSNRSVAGLLLLYVFGFFFGWWVPFLSLSSLFTTSPGFSTEVADFLDRCTSLESVLLISLILAILLLRGRSRRDEEEKKDSTGGQALCG